MSRTISQRNLPVERAVSILHERGMFQQRGSQSELARIFGVSRQYVYWLMRRAEGTACFNMLENNDGN